MSQKTLVCSMDDVKGKTAHGGAATIRILIDDLTCGAKNFSHRAFRLQLATFAHA